MLAASNDAIRPYPALFTYGTLMRGESRFGVIKNIGVSCAVTAFAFGTLSTNSHYPSLKLMGDGYSRGDYFLSNDIVELLMQTDIIEGFNGFGSDNNFFRRTLVEVDVGALSPRLAWVYVMDNELDARLPKNDWRDFKGKRRTFSTELVRYHASKVEGFYEGLTRNWDRYGRTDGKNSPLTTDEVIELLMDEQTLTEKTMAQVSNCWKALTNIS